MCVTIKKFHQIKLTQICSLTRLSCRKTVLTLKSIPTVETKAEVNESSAYRNKNDVLPTLEFPITKSLNTLKTRF